MCQSYGRSVLQKYSYFHGWLKTRWSSWVKLRCLDTFEAHFIELIKWMSHHSQWSCLVRLKKYAPRRTLTELIKKQTSYSERAGSLASEIYDSDSIKWCSLNPCPIELFFPYPSTHQKSAHNENCLQWRCIKKNKKELWLSRTITNTCACCILLQLGYDYNMMKFHTFFLSHMSLDGLMDMEKKCSIGQGLREHHLMLSLSCISDVSEPALSEYEVCF